ncbi:Ig-like domain-containing protein [Steroidobacter denitrificans]|uniref:Ig-like domain-containing protein n=1 Tax=Steroidobacter denitrificans TaxID=465721 RepID=UPI0014394B78|nr:Ig-like domain-containing protein [Steroidobacter denitrificans]
MSIAPLDGKLEISETLQMSARLLYPDGTSEDATTRVTWQSSDDHIGSFDTTTSNGRLSAKAPGSIQITASLDDLSAQAIVTVLLSPGTTRGPLRVSSVNPRYFETDQGVSILLAGSHTWASLQDNGTTSTPPPFDYTTYLRFLSDHGHNFFRLWAWEQSRWVVTATNDQNWLAPSAFERTGPGLALDGLPKFDLTRFNQGYFDRLRERVEQAREQGIYVAVMLFNGFSVSKSKPSSPPGNRNPWHGHPFNAANNVNGVNGDPDGNDSGEETHELAVESVTTYQEAYVRKMIDTLNDLDNVLYEISNESHGNSQDWQYHMIEVIHSYEATKSAQHPVGMTVEWPGGDNDELLASRAAWISPLGEIKNRPVATGAKVILADTDHLCGICGDPGWVWRSFTAGENPLLMDPYDLSNIVGGLPNVNIDDPGLVGARRNLGYAIRMSQRMNLGRALPRPELTSTGHCLADMTGPTPTLLAYSPGDEEIIVDLEQLPEDLLLNVEWLRPATGVSIGAGTTTGGAQRMFRPPFPGDAVLLLHGAP